MKTESQITFENFDCFELKKFCERLEAFANVEHDYVEGSLVLALSAGFGSGKSTFIEMWRCSLLNRRDKGEFAPVPVLLNAWESDHCGEPLLAVLAGLVEALEDWKGDDAPDKGKLKNAAKEVGWFATGLANEFVAKWTGLNAAKAEEYAATKTGSRRVPVPDFISMYQQRIDALHALKCAMRDAFGGPSPKVIVFVDELDRCRPDYAVAYLETIKHVFDIEGMVFVLAVDYGQLKGSVKVLFGDHLEFEEYFRKFCHRTLPLPAMTEDSYRRIVRKYVRKYLAVEGKRMSLLKVSEGQGLEKRAIELAEGFKLRPRQVQDCFRVLGHTMQTYDPSLEGRILWGIAAGTVLLSFLRAGAPLVFDELRHGAVGIPHLCSLLVQRLGKKNAEWWVQLVLSGSWDNVGSNDFIDEILKELGYLEGGENDIRQYLSGFADGWGHHGMRVKEIAKKIEAAETF